MITETDISPDASVQPAGKHGQRVIKLKNINVFQKKNLVLSEVNLNVNKGEFVYLIGKTGSGKSSLLKVLYGELKINQGIGEIAGKNFGCGSSREHAPQSLSKWGITGIIGESFAEIFFANCQAMGIPCFAVSNQDCDHLYQTIT